MAHMKDVTVEIMHDRSIDLGVVYSWLTTLNLSAQLQNAVAFSARFQNWGAPVGKQVVEMSPFASTACVKQ